MSSSVKRIKTAHTNVEIPDLLSDKEGYKICSYFNDTYLTEKNFYTEKCDTSIKFLW